VFSVYNENQGLTQFEGRQFLSKKRKYFSPSNNIYKGEGRKRTMGGE